MGLRTHPTGGYRAYKKIDGVEYQFYSRDYNEAKEKQEYFEQLASLKAKQVFSACGRLKGCRLNIYRRKGRPAIIIGRVATGPFRAQKTLEIRYKGNFEVVWKFIKQEWKKAYKLTSGDMSDYRIEIKEANRLYIYDLGKLESELEGNYFSDNLILDT